MAVFADAGYPNNSPSDFTSSIDWGDGTTTAGIVSGGNGTFTVSDLSGANSLLQHIVAAPSGGNFNPLWLEDGVAKSASTSTITVGGPVSIISGGVVPEPASLGLLA